MKQHIGHILGRYEKLLEEVNQTKGRLLSEVNRDLDQQRRLEAVEQAKREAIEALAKQNKENQEEVVILNKQVYTLT